MAARIRIGAIVLGICAVSVCAALFLATRTAALPDVGDVNCDATISTVDAAMVLYYEAHLQELPCRENADTNGDARVDSKDAALILQIVADLWFPTVQDNDCPPQGCPTSTPCSPEGCPTAPPAPTSTPCPVDGCPTPTSTQRPYVTRTPSPTPPDSVMGVEFSIAIDADGDGLDDCSTRDSDSNTCVVTEGVPFRLNVRLDRLPANLPQYDGFDIVGRYLGVEPIGVPDADVWPDCGFEVIAPAIPGRLAFGCAIGVSENGPGARAPSSYVGRIGTQEFTSFCGKGSVSLQDGNGNTALADGNLVSHLEARDGEETLYLTCDPNSPPLSTPNTTPTPTPTLTPTPARVSGGPQFSISADMNGDGVADCTSSGDIYQRQCHFNEFPVPRPYRTLFVNLDALPDGVSSYEGFGITLDYNKFVPGPVDTHWWPDCVTPNASPHYLRCTTGEPPESQSTYLGVVATIQFGTGCDTEQGVITLKHGAGSPYVTSGGLSYSDSDAEDEQLTFSCIHDGGLPPGCLFGQCLTTPAPLP